MRSGDYELAARAANKALNLVSTLTPAIHWVMEGFAGPPGIFLALWEDQHADLKTKATKKELRQLAQRGCKGMHSYARFFPIGRPRAWLYQGLYDWLAKKPHKATKAWVKSLTYSKELKMPYEQGLAHFEIGRHLPSNDPERHLHLNEALTIFERLGTTYDAERVREFLGLPMNFE